MNPVDMSRTRDAMDLFEPAYGRTGWTYVDPGRHDRHQNSRASRFVAVPYPDLSALQRKIAKGKPHRVRRSLITGFIAVNGRCCR